MLNPKETQVLSSEVLFEVEVALELPQGGITDVYVMGNGFDQAGQKALDHVRKDGNHPDSHIICVTIFADEGNLVSRDLVK